MEAADAVAKYYYNQDPRLLRFVLSKPPDRVTYGDLTLIQKDWEKIAHLAKESGVLSRPMQFTEICDAQFSKKTYAALPYDWER